MCLKSTGLTVRSFLDTLPMKHSDFTYLSRIEFKRYGITDPVQCKYVPTNLNHADEGSRGLRAEEFVNKSKWLTGPDFLWNSEVSASLFVDTELQLDNKDPDVKRAFASASKAHDFSSCDDILTLCQLEKVFQTFRERNSRLPQI